METLTQTLGHETLLDAGIGEVHKAESCGSRRSLGRADNMAVTRRIPIHSIASVRL